MKSTGVAYLLCIIGFFGVAGLHRFYAGKWVTGLTGCSPAGCS